jgi:hypothetical protein
MPKFAASIAKIAAIRDLPLSPGRNNKIYPKTRLRFGTGGAIESFI